MELEKILKSITAGLSGEPEKDIPYLQAKCEEYKDHEYSQEIIRACGRLLYDVIPDDMKEKLDRIISNDEKGTESIIKEIRFNVFEGNLEKAFALSEALVEKTEGMHMYENDAASEYFTFNEPFEQILYVHYNHPQRDIRHANIPYAEIFYLHGNLLFELKRIQEAREYLKKALRWNPVSCTIGFEYIETFKVEKELDTFFKLTKDQLKYAFKPKDVARCFRNLAYYYVEMREYSVAAACCVMSMMYDNESNLAQSELYYIQQISPEGYQETTVELLEQYKVEFGLPTRASDEVVELAAACIQKTYDDGNLEFCTYFLNIFCGLRDNEKAKELLKEINNKLSKDE